MNKIIILLWIYVGGAVMARSVSTLTAGCDLFATADLITGLW